MNDWNTKNRPQKEDARMYALSELGNQPCSLWMPGDKCLCIAKALELGSLNLSDRLVVVERDPKVFSKLKINLGQWSWKNKPRLFQAELSNITLPHPLNFAFLDFLGSFESDVAYWIKSELARNLEDDATICVTHSYGWRNNQFMYLIHRSLKAGWASKYREFQDHLRIYNHYIIFPLMMLKCLFNEFEFEIRWPVRYQDSVRSMMVYRLEKFSRLSSGTNGWPTLDEVLEFGQSNLGDRVMKTKKSKAALKAWVTRRENDRFAKRSVAAKKAWKTRRVNGDGVDSGDGGCGCSGGDPGIAASDVITALVEEKRGRSQLFDRYVDQQVDLGYAETRVRAAIKAHVTRRVA